MSQEKKAPISPAIAGIVVVVVLAIIILVGRAVITKPKAEQQKEALGPESGVHKEMMMKGGHGDGGDKGSQMPQ